MMCFCVYMHAWLRYACSARARVYTHLFQCLMMLLYLCELVQSADVLLIYMYTRHHDQGFCSATIYIDQCVHIQVLVLHMHATFVITGIASYSNSFMVMHTVRYTQDTYMDVAYSATSSHVHVMSLLIMISRHPRPVTVSNSAHFQMEIGNSRLQIRAVGLGSDESFRHVCTCSQLACRSTYGWPCHWAYAGTNIR